MERESNVVAFLPRLREAEIPASDHGDAPERAVEPRPLARVPNLVADAEGPCVLVYDCASPEIDPAGQIRAGRYRYVGPVALSGDLDPLFRPGRVLIEPKTGLLENQDLPEGQSLFALLGYAEFAAVETDLVITVGDRNAATAISRGTGIAWRGDHIVIGRGQRTAFLEILLHGLGVIGTINAERLAQDLPPMGWYDLFPAVRARLTFAVDDLKG